LSLFFVFLHRHGGGLRHARSSPWAIPTSPPMADPCSHDVSLHIPTRAGSRGIPHASQRALFPRHSCREIPTNDVTRAPSLRSFLCRPARAHRPGNPLRAFREQNTRYAARDALHRRPRGTPRVPNSTNTRRHFNRPRDGLFRNAGRSRAGFPARRCAREGRSLNAERAPYASSCEAGAVTTITLYGAKGSPHPSPVWTGPSSTSSHALTHTMTLTPYLPTGTHFSTHSGTITQGNRVTTSGPRISLLHKLRVYPFASDIPSTSHGSIGLNSSRSASREHSVSLCSLRRLSCCLHRVTIHSPSSTPLSPP